MRRKATVSLFLRLISEDVTTVIGEDADGDRRCFQKADLHSCIVNRRYESVSVVMDWSVFKKMKPMKADFSPNSEIVLKRRKCLNCRSEFEAHPSIFICDPCKSTVHWRAGGEYSLAT
jgi:hypothetical protein